MNEYENRRIMTKKKYLKPIVKTMAADEEELLAGSPLVYDENTGELYQNLGDEETDQTSGNLSKRYNAWDEWEK